MTQAWAGVDVGKEHHWAVVVDHEGRVLLSRHVLNGEDAIVELVREVRALADHLTWAVDLSNGYVALLLAVLWDAGQRVVYMPGKAVNRAADGYRGEGKTDRKDALIIADQSRLRRDFAQLAPKAELLTELALLLRHRRDIATDRQRLTVRLRELLSGLCPALERALDVTCKGPLLLLTRWQTPAAIRRTGAARVTAFLAGKGIPRADGVAQAAVTAAKAQTRRLPGEQITARLVAKLARDLLDFRDEIKELDGELEERFRAHPQADIITSLPGMGVLLAAEFAVAIGDLGNFTGPDHLAAYAGVAPVPHDSGQVQGNLNRPQRYNRALMRVFYLSSISVIGRPGASRDYYQRKRREGKRHVQAVIALARRRVNVLWAMLRDNQPYAHRDSKPTLAAA